MFQSAGKKTADCEVTLIVAIVANGQSASHCSHDRGETSHSACAGYRLSVLNRSRVLNELSACDKLLLGDRRLRVQDIVRQKP
jgi:hypothetical protein